MVQQRAPGTTVWLTGLPSAGKSTTAEGLRRYLSKQEGDRGVVVLDGDVLRRGVNADLGFSQADRTECTRRTGEVALLLASHGFIVIASLVSPYAAARLAVRRRHDRAGVPFIEVWLSAPLTTCEARDPKHLYARARRGELRMVTGLDDPYEPPTDPELVLPTDVLSVESTVQRLAETVLSFHELPVDLRRIPRVRSSSTSTAIIADVRGDR